MNNKPENTYYLPAGLPIPVSEPDGLSEPFWSGLKMERLRIQHCSHCHTWQFGPEWLCHHCRRFDPDWKDIEPKGKIYSWERVWHPSHDALKNHGPYVAILVELPQAGNVPVIGNLLGDPMQDVVIGAEVVGEFEHHHEAMPSYSLLQWRYKES